VSLSELRPALEAEGIIVRKEATTDGSVR
jgi:hypothetical protein